MEVIVGEAFPAECQEAEQNVDEYQTRRPSHRLLRICPVSVCRINCRRLRAVIARTAWITRQWFACPWWIVVMYGNEDDGDDLERNVHPVDYDERFLALAMRVSLISRFQRSVFKSAAQSVLQRRQIETDCSATATSLEATGRRRSTFHRLSMQAAKRGRPRKIKKIQEKKNNIAYLTRHKVRERNKWTDDETQGKMSELKYVTKCPLF